MCKINQISIVVLILAIFVSSAYAYSPQYVDKEKTTKISWKKKRIPIAISDSLLNNSNNIKDNSKVLQAIKNSLKSWEAVANIKFELTFSNRTSVSRAGTSGDNISLITIAQTTDNFLLFGGKLDKASAITRLFYTKKGVIKEADIVLNPILLFSTDGTFGSFDVEATLTHEIGHFLGLGHSQIYGSTMHSHQAKNGIYNRAGFSSRSLAEDDKAAAISLYGKNKNNKLCCSKLSGNIELSPKNSDKEIVVWLEESNSARVIAGTTSNKDGSYLIEGIPKTVYKIYASDAGMLYSTQFLGTLDLTKSNFKVVNRKIEFENSSLLIDRIGVNGQLSNLSIPTSAGDTHTIYFSSNLLNLKDVNISFHTDSIKVIPNSILEHDYGIGGSVFSFEIYLRKTLAEGEYSFYIGTNNSEKKHIIGGISVEKK